MYELPASVICTLNTTVQHEEEAVFAHVFFFLSNNKNRAFNILWATVQSIFFFCLNRIGSDFGVVSDLGYSGLLWTLDFHV